MTSDDIATGVYTGRVRWLCVILVCACHTDAQPHGDAVRATSWQSWASLDTHTWIRSEQLLHRAPALRPLEFEAAPFAFDVLFSPTAAAHVEAHGLARPAVTTFPAFPTDAAIVKLVWYPLPPGASVELPVWDGDPALPAGNPTSTWSRTVTITDAERDQFIHDDDHILVGAHLTTKALPDWTWATFWWHDRPDDGPYAAGRPDDVRDAARHYLMNAAFTADEPCFNPYLEARFPDGESSSCLACHRRAVVGATKYLPVTHGRLADDDPYLRGHVPTDFVWSLALEPH